MFRKTRWIRKVGSKRQRMGEWLSVYYWCLEEDDKILIPCHALTGVDVTKVKFRNVFMTVTPRHAPRDTCDEGLPMPTFLCFTENVYEGVSSDLINNFWFRIPLAFRNFLSLYFQMLLVISFPRKGKHIQGRAQSRLGVFFDSIKCMKPWRQTKFVDRGQSLTFLNKERQTKITFLINT